MPAYHESVDEQKTNLLACSALSIAAIFEGPGRQPAIAARDSRRISRTENIFIIILLRRRPDAPPLPTLEYWANTPFPERKYLSRTEFASKYGALETDIELISEFVKLNGMSVNDVDVGSRMVRVSGTAKQTKGAFQVELAHYRFAGEEYRGYDGFV